MTDNTQCEIFIKNVELAGEEKAKEKAILKTKWNNKEVSIEIFINNDDSPEIYIGSCSQESLKNNKINVDYSTIKESLTSSKPIPAISYELNHRRMKFSVITQEETSGSEDAADIIYLTSSLKKLEPVDVIPLSFQLVHDMETLLSLKSTVERCKIEQELMAQQIELLKADKVKSDELQENLLQLMNAKKRQITKLEQKIKKPKRSNNKLLNLSSDFDQSDLSIRETPAQSSQDASQELMPTTSKAESYKSPVRKKAGSKNNSPIVKTSPRRTPRKVKLTPSRKLFEFQPVTESDDSVDEPLSPKKSLRAMRSKPVDDSSDSMFANLSVKIPLKKTTNDSQSSSDLYISKPGARKRLISSSSDSSKKSRDRSFTPDIVQLAQKPEFEENPKAKSQLKEKQKSSEHMNLSCDQIFTQDVMTNDDSDEVQSSQPTDSPSIFGTFSKRKVGASDGAPKKVSKKSKFSVDTIDILGIHSP